jgi:hypothetical protein
MQSALNNGATKEEIMELMDVIHNFRGTCCGSLQGCVEIA